MTPYDDDEFVATMTEEEAARVNAMPSISVDDALAELTKRTEVPAKKRKGAK